MSTTTTLAGGCLCGALRYNLAFPKASPPDCMHCYCGVCKKSTGAYFETYVPTTHAQLHWTTNRRSQLRIPPPGSPSITLIVGSLDDVDAVKVGSHLFYENIARVAKEVDRDLPKYHGEFEFIQEPKA
ncbi:LOW QUALITY PROTEIN: Mss4-like protein [Jimgerdemannia flammicorona]|uniref:Mss4-like protein n=1 Tax=Jimgerdemannia flammicorona TaxID=994334 RepID=A0A433Q696_9FUNG|nr:LOW QUALITY PROTEIN: Mss4-like protein [Jimgerdemannia flammicorona]